MLLNIVALVGWGLFLREPPPEPLWPGSHYTEQDREAALERGLKYIYTTAANPTYFSRMGSDLLFCFYSISNTARSPKLRQMALEMGRERAREWRRHNTEPPVHDAVDFYLFVYGAMAADKLLGPDPVLRTRIGRIATSFSAVEFLGFDPRYGPPPADIPDRCPKCGYQNPRGAITCRRCQARLTFRSSYDVWTDALIRTRQGDDYGATLGVSYPEVLKWISRMRPYPYPSPANDENEDEFNDVSYAVTHVVYTLNDYHQYRLSPAWLPQELAYLKQNIDEARNYENGELLGEFVDALRAFGDDESDPKIQMAIDYLLARQNPDGSWGDRDDSDEDIYTRFHSTWTAVDGLRQYSFKGQRLRNPELLPLLQGKIESQPR